MDLRKIGFLSQKIILEGVFALPAGGGPFGLVVVCHPHPLYGGNMDNRVVHALCQKLGEKGLAWLKFNFRGVGKSGGHFGGGTGEKEDARAAISFAQQQAEIDSGKIGICGYSFGSMVAFSVAMEDPRVRAVAGISPFLHPADVLQHYPKPKLFISGTDDEFIDPESLAQLVLRLPEPKELAIYPKADHFWNGSEDSMAEKVGQFFVHSLG